MRELLGNNGITVMWWTALAVVGALKTGSEDAGLTPFTLADVDRIDVLEGEIKIKFKPGVANKEEIALSWSKPPSRRRRELVTSNRESEPDRPMRAETRSRLLKGIAQGRIWLDQLISFKNQSISDIAAHHKLSERSVRSNLCLALLAPEIVEAAIDSRLPRGITVTQLAELPADWDQQKQALGFA